MINWYNNLNYKLVRNALDGRLTDLSCSKKTFASLKKHAHLKLRIFDPPPHFLISVYFTCTIPSLSLQHAFALVSYPTPSQRKFQDAYVFFKEKSGGEKREKNY